MKVFAVLSGVLAAAMAAPAAQLPAGVSAAICPDYPFCATEALPGLAYHEQAVALAQQQVATLQAVLPHGVPGLAAHQAAEAAQLAAMGVDIGSIAHAEEVNRANQVQAQFLAFQEAQAAALAAL